MMNYGGCGGGDKAGKKFARIVPKKYNRLPIPRFGTMVCQFGDSCLFTFKSPIMKLSKSLLSAVLIGIAVQAGTSCTKSKDDPDNKQKTEAQKESEKNKVPKDPCPACGMG